MSDRKYVVVRTYSAGVPMGELISQNGKEMTLVNARRIWSWKGANTLNEVAVQGVAVGSRVSRPVPEIVLTESIEVITCTEIGATNLKGATWTA